MPRPAVLLSMIALMAAAVASVLPARAENAQTQRGKYLVAIAGCGDCHTPGNFLGHPDMAKFLGGSDVGFAVPHLGVFVGPNLTPDRETGLGSWTEREIVTAITTGKRPDGRMLAPVMPWRDFASLTPPDAQAIAAYLKSLPPVSHKVPGPFGTNETPNVLVFTIQPGSVYARLPALQ
jgi:mono/diheme cytochrome c family protein